MSDVSLKQGHASLVSPGVTAAPVLSTHSSKPVLFSQFRGPFAFNMAETDEERQKREEAERQANEDEEKKSNFKKVQEAREAAEARAAEAEKKLREREEADRKAAEAKLADEKKFEELAQQREAEAKAKADEAAREKARADAAEAKVKTFEDAQEAELVEILKGIPDEKKPPLDDTDPVSKRLAQAKYAKSLLESGKKPAVGAGVRKEVDASAQDRLTELTRKPRRTPAETQEMLRLNEELKGS
jgi:uncharacterized membrane protein YqiK